MSRFEQEKINAIVLSEYEDCMALINERYDFDLLPKPIPLNYCQASVYSIDEYFILKSYDTIVACINTDKRIFVDFLRYEYFYTSTSCQHIAKFKRKYSEYFDENSVYVWRDIK